MTQNDNHADMVAINGTHEDLLNRGPFVELLDGIVTKKVEEHQGFSLAIDGKWGCGKTRILSMLEERLRSKYLVIHYNCWKNDYYEEPLVAIMSTVVDALNSIRPPEGAEYDLRRRKICIAGNLLKSLALSIVKNKLGVDFEDIGVTVDDLEKMSKDALDADKQPLLSNDFDDKMPLKGAISSVRNTLLWLKNDLHGIVIVVDELDRCLPEYAIKVLERLHHLTYDELGERFLFIQLLAMDKGELVDAISKVFGRSTFRIDSLGYMEKSYVPRALNGDFHFADYYLQKFVQMIVPVPSGDNSGDALTILNGLGQDFNLDEDAEGRNLVAGLLSRAFAVVPMRIKEETIEFAKTVHWIAMGSFRAEHCKPIKFSPEILCLEIIECFCRAIVKCDLPGLMTDDGKEDAIEKCYYFDVECNRCYVDSLEKFKSDVRKWSMSWDGGELSPKNYDSSLKATKMFNMARIMPKQIGFPGANEEEKRVISLRLPIDRLKSFYLKNDSKKYSLEEGESVNAIDYSFVEVFRKTLDILAP